MPVQSPASFFGPLPGYEGTLPPRPRLSEDWIRARFESDGKHFKISIEKVLRHEGGKLVEAA